MLKENILDDVYNYIGKFIWFPNDHYRVAATAWIAHTHLIETFETEGFHTPRLAVLSPAKRSGKTRVLDIIELLVQNPESMISPTPSAVYTLTGCSEVTPTLLIDEIGRMIDRKDFGDFATIVEAGFKPGKSIPRTTFNSEGKRRVYAPMLMAGIDNGRMPDTFIDRSIIISMKRNIGKRLSYRPRKHAAEGLALREKLAQWAMEVRDKIQDIDPVMPDELNDREQDKWEALFILGQLADVTDVTHVTNVTGNFRWLQKIKLAALEIAKEDKDKEDTSNGELLLKDIYSILNDIDKIQTSKLLENLNSIDESPWSSYNYNKPLDGSGLARLLKPYNIRPKTIRFEKDTDKGYHTSQFEDAFERYLRHHETPVTPVTEVTPVTTKETMPVKITPETLEKLITPGMTYEEYQDKRKALIASVS
jgi:Protein of unknown function (DUF3631)